MDQFHLMQVFVAVGEQKSFAAAARSLNISPAAVTRAVSTLEGHLGVLLVDRSTRHAAPEQSAQSTPSSINRSLRRGRPLPWEFARYGAHLARQKP